MDEVAMRYKFLLEPIKEKSSYKKILKAAKLSDKLSKKEKAEAMLNQLKCECKWDEELVAVYYLIGNLHYVHNDELAIEAYEQALSYNPTNSWIWMRLASVYNNLKQYDRAKECCKNAVNNNPTDYLINLHAASEFLDCKAWKEALESAMFVRDKDPEESEAVYVAAIACKMLGNDVESEWYCTEYGRMYEDMEDLRVTVEEYWEENRKE